nr:hypothetical protein [Candidatus Pantoea persica]
MLLCLHTALNKRRFSHEVIRPAEVYDLLPLPLYIEHVPCGFPSSARDYIENASILTI